MKLALKVVCEREGLAPKLVANTSDIEAVAESDDADVPLMHGWRREVFGNLALELKRGKAMIGFRDGRVIFRPQRLINHNLGNPAHFRGEARQSLFNALAHQVLQFFRQRELQGFPFGHLEPDARQHAGHGGRQDIGKAENGTQQMGPHHLVVIEKMHQAVTHLLAFVAIENGERQKHPAGMIDADKGGL